MALKVKANDGIALGTGTQIHNKHTAHSHTHYFVYLAPKNYRFHDKISLLKEGGGMGGGNESFLRFIVERSKGTTTTLTCRMHEREEFLLLHLTS